MSAHLIVDDVEPNDELNGLEDLEQEVEEQDALEHEENVDETPSGDEAGEKEEVSTIPPKFKDASKEDVARAYAELEKTLGRQGQEMGELRKLADEFIKRELDRNSTPKESKKRLEFEDLVEDPEAAVTRAVEDRFKSVEDRFNQYEREKSINDFAAKHPDFQEIGADPQFHEWVKQSPYRIRQFQAADKFDLDAADELMSTWKERQSVVKQEVEGKQKVKREKALKKASAESGSGSEAPRKVYRRADLIRLRLNNPEKYSAMEDEIVRAYAEGRVK